ncbi:hypothetical protein ABID22_003412 [Pontibacter aydingkolensis]|uniref:MG2 domain-containing protein n=1 Tax=Pontibacter aydingkolensis TaxID=1911536 RepID=A0ABS7CY80_9BACT|nr:hypothetical protein [Pontibacter aydingkolensis]MBW7468806.1 hypothetical protein [Pontibacter aydingkolensis]
MAKAYLQAILCFILCIGSAGQATAQTDAFKSIEQNFDLHRKNTLQEKMFLHLDRPVYACGETMWFKLYNVDATLHQLLDISKIAYIEVLDVAQKPVLQTKFALKGGTGNGSFAIPATLNSGNYTVRAYTNLMKNYGPELFFEQPVTIVNTFKSLDQEAAPKPTTYAIQFFPEGGNMVAGVTNTVAFKTVDQTTGKGVDFSGELHDQHGNKVAAFKPYKFGAGHFTFVPAQGEKYTATLKLADNRSVVQPLPKVYDQGYALHLEHTGNGQIKITVNQPGKQAEQLYLLGHTRRMIAVSEAATLNQGAAVFLVDEKVLADGITHFTVFNAQKQPICERLYFKRPSQPLQFEIKADKQQYGTREKINLEIVGKTKTGDVAPAFLSMAVYQLDSLQTGLTNNIESYLRLTSDLKGEIENPDYYFTGVGAADTQAMDNLMLTHGWSRFKWEDILDKEPVAYQYVPEYNGHLINGKVTHVSNGAPAPGITTYLSSPGKHIRLQNGVSDANGLVRFELKDFFGQKDIIVQSNFAKDSTYHFEIFNPFSDKYSTNTLPAFGLSEKLHQDVTLRHVQTQVQHAYFGNYHNRFRPAGIDSTAFYGLPSDQYLLDDYKRFKVMEEVMREYVPGVHVRKRRGKFHFMVLDRPNKSIFQDNPMVLLDGVPVFDIDKIMAFDPLKVNKLDVTTSRFFNGPLVFDGLVSYTTYQGDLAGFELDPRSLLQSYEGLQREREFYAPTYETEEQKRSRLADFRNLLYWAPNVNTTAKGKAGLQFYTSDIAGKYIIILQGISKKGIPIYSTHTFEVN